MGFSQGPSRPEKTTCDERRSSNAGDLKPTVPDAGDHWGNISSEFPALESKWAKLFNLSRSVTSTGPVLFKRPARYTSASSRRRRAPPPTEAGSGEAPGLLTPIGTASLGTARLDALPTIIFKLHGALIFISV